MSNKRKENIRLLQLAMQGRLKPEDLITKNGIKVTLRLGPDADYPGTYEEWLNSLPKQKRVEKGTRYISVTLNLS